MTKYELSEKWIKASVTGTIWAAFEIVIGSFLHNLKIPFSGNILAGIGIIILISVSYAWQEKGLFWRAGLICAVMKTISPSAVIFGPIVAILSEALLLEASVRLFGRTFFGFAVGAILAMSWNLFQRIANLLLFYGLNIWELYENLIKLAQKQLHIETDLLWLPLIVLLIIYCLMGLGSALLGIRIGRKLLENKREHLAEAFQSLISTEIRNNQTFSYSLIWLLADLVMLVSALTMLNYTQIVYWVPFIIGVAVLWAFRYKRALRQLKKPRFWLIFVAITMLAALVFSKVQDQTWQEGMLVGLQMNFRAIVVVLGFSVLGTELYNPVIRTFFLKTSFKQLPAALELSFESLPEMIAHIPDFKTILKNPVSVIYQVIQKGEERLLEIKSQHSKLPKVFIVTGSVGEGKTTFVKEVAKILNKKGLNVGGILSIRLMDRDETKGYDLLDLSTGKSEPFLRLAELPSESAIGRFAIRQEGLKWGNQVLRACMNSQQQLVVLDEIGKLELRGEGWVESMQQLLNQQSSVLLTTVRQGFEKKIIEKWQIKDYELLPVGMADPQQLADRILLTMGVFR